MRSRPGLVGAVAIGVAMLALATAGRSTAAEPARWPPVASWGYQLKDVDADKVAASAHDVVVIDYARDGGQDTAFTPADLVRMKRKPDGGRRIVLAYLSIGEAEAYRYYFDARWNWLFGFYGWLFGPAWKGKENRHWAENYAVRYWTDDWQRIIAGEGDSYVGRIVAAGFDGVWLDKVDSSSEAIGREISDPHGAMVAFVAKIAARARAENARFLVVPQNGEHLLGDARFGRTIDGLGAEDVFYGDPVNGRRNAKDVTNRRLPQLAMFARSGKPVFAVEYVRRKGEIATARHLLAENGLIPLVTDRHLGQIDPPNAE